jgi:hypothetical protein
MKSHRRVVGTKSQKLYAIKTKQRIYTENSLECGFAFCVCVEQQQQRGLIALPFGQYSN